MAEPLQDESQRTSLIERLDRQLHEALAERDRTAEVAKELAGALRAALNAESGPLDAVTALTHYEALKEEAK